MDASTLLPELAVLADDPPCAATLHRVGEHFAAGFYEVPAGSLGRRWARAFRRWLEHRAMLPYGGTRLYPWGASSLWASVPDRWALLPNLAFTWEYRPERLPVAAGAERLALERLDRHFRALEAIPRCLTGPHTVGGNAFTHTVPDYARVSGEGLAATEARLRGWYEEAVARGDAARAEFYRGQCDLLEGIRAWHGRLLTHLGAWEAPDAAAAARRDALVAALHQVPFGPARTFYEALVAHTVVFYLDQCDNPGRLDLELAPYYEADLAAGRITRDEALDLLREFTQIVCDNNTWSASIGGTDPQGRPAYSEVTALCLEAVIGHHRPNYQLRVRRDMPDAIWERALDAIGAATGQPALHHEEGYLAGLRAWVPELTDDDLAWMNGSGCTETLIQGRTNVGSVDAGFNLPLLLEATLRRVLPTAASFDEVLAAFEADLVATIAETIGRLNAVQRNRAAFMPDPMRTLLVADCLERGLDFHAGGARFNWSLLSLAGLANVADSLAALREVVFEERSCTGEGLLRALAADFVGYAALRARLARCPRYGNDDPAVDTLAARVYTVAVEEMRRHRTFRGNGPFIPCCILFTGAPGAGAQVGATPDGRGAGEPIADAVGPYPGRDRRGPTATIASVTRVPLGTAVGTPVFNLRLQPELFRTSEGRGQVRGLVETFFARGGLQMQLTVADAATLREALAHPERYANLAVRVGGFSARFVDLSPALQQAILTRTEHGG